MPVPGSADDYRGERVPTLAEALAVLGELGLGANIEMKADRGRESETGAAAAALLSRLWPRDLPAPLVSSFLEALLGSAGARPAIATRRPVPRRAGRLADRAERLGCATIDADHRRLHPALVAEIRDAGYRLARLHRQRSRAGADCCSVGG